MITYGKEILLTHLSFFSIRVAKIPLSVTGKAVMLNATTPSVLGVSFNEKRPQTTPNYIVLDTDYENYTLVYTCRIEPSFFKSEKKVEYAWLLSRERTMKPETVEKLRGKLSGLGVDVDKLMIIPQNCDN
jgi:lipocalin